MEAGVNDAVSRRSSLPSVLTAGREPKTDATYEGILAVNAWDKCLPFPDRSRHSLTLNDGSSVIDAALLASIHS